MEDLKEEFPAFAAIIDTPNASIELSRYVADTKNPLEVRLAAVTVLGYIDKQTFENSFHVLAKSFDDVGPQARQYLSATQFIGIPPLHFER